MCGFAGIIDRKEPFISEEIIKNMIEPINHRGPDDTGLYCNNNFPIGLGFKRLSIIDLAHGHQPMSNKDESVWVLFNGEIYNYIELQKDLITKGYNFNTNCDTESLLHGYTEYGVEIFSKLNGMFSIAIWDDRTKELFLCRDRAGEKPLYYYLDDNKIIFGSEIKSLLQYPNLIKEINWDAFNEYFSFGYISAPNSIYKNIHKVKQGCYIKYKNGIISDNRYWRINTSLKFEGNYNEAKVQLNNILEDSVKIRLNSDVPLGAFLSGGLDSSAIVATMASLSSKPIKTFSIGYDEPKYDERKYAKSVSEMYETDHTELVMQPHFGIDQLENIILNYDEPFGDSSTLPTFEVSRLTREYVTVSLSGDAGDELFGGYTSYQEITRLSHMIDKIPKIGLDLAQYLSKYITPKNKITKIIKFMGLPDHSGRFAWILTHFQEHEKAKLFSRDVLSYIKNDGSVKEIKTDYFDNELEFGNKMLYSDFNHYLPDDILVKVDRMSMLNSLESRAPFLDYRLIEFAFSLPFNWKVNNKEGKLILKDSMYGMLPKDVIYRKKMGFGVPINNWFKKELNEYCRYKLLNNKNQSIFNLKKIEHYITMHESGVKNYSERIWFLLCFILWAENNQMI